MASSPEGWNPGPGVPSRAPRTRGGPSGSNLRKNRFGGARREPTAHPKGGRLEPAQRPPKSRGLSRTLPPQNDCSPRRRSASGFRAAPRPAEIGSHGFRRQSPRQNWHRRHEGRHQRRERACVLPRRSPGRTDDQTRPGQARHSHCQCLPRSKACRPCEAPPKESVPPRLASHRSAARIGTGSFLLVWVPSPNWPESFAPQLQSVPSFRRARVCDNPASTAVHFQPGRMATGDLALSVVPLPNLPDPLEPQVQREPSDRMAAEWYPPAATTCQTVPGWIWVGTRLSA